MFTFGRKQKDRSSFKAFQNFYNLFRFVLSLNLKCQKPLIQHLKKIEIPVVLKGIAILVLLCASPFAGSTQEGLVINEFMLSNSDAFSASDDEYPDWIELYNGSNEDVNLQGYGLSDNYDDPFKWVFPDVSIPQGDYMVVFASGEENLAICFAAEPKSSF